MIKLPKPGSYVLAVSGGIDSVCLLDMMSSLKGYDLTVAHFDHGIRPESYQDLEFVKELAGTKNIRFVSAKVNLGPNASEAVARARRYDFLNSVKDQVNAVAIITAHHQDDRLETMVLNLIRGTGRLGLSPMIESVNLKRPLLDVTKEELISYARQHKLSWREDNTNIEERYLRNYIRLNILSRISLEDKKQFIKLMDHQAKLNQQIDEILGSLLKNQGRTLDRGLIRSLPYIESKELVAAWLRANQLIGFSKKTIERLTIAAKTKPSGARLDVYNRAVVTLMKDSLALNSMER